MNKINRNLVIKKLRCKNPNAQAYRMFWSDDHQYLGYFLVDSDDRITMAHKLLNRELNHWQELIAVRSKLFSCNTMHQLVYFFAEGIPDKVEFDGFEFKDILPDNELNDRVNMDIPSKYIKNSLLKILEAPVYSIDDQIFNAFMNRG
ncbi:hypothetical protein BOW89_gp033 [Escherichia phage WG01]|uniref:Uncharacterized protein n=1 Tax=Escherichia phage WG01 TaxID=1837931 RepID=A0A172Q0X6_9CAUD|nr:hypothetical protein BOW89_gp033 [Escherichia phage WG01]AND75705.1 hypothetical protein WG01_33 [Escherichia phage WG01]QXV72393.1 hypothetical protein PSD9_108 [Shigella phage PSD9]WPJ21502.1 hypothetical protein [Salmonella phage vB_SalD_ABTNLS3]